MAEPPIRISVELEGIEPNERFQAACDELVAAAAELIEETAEVAGHSLVLGESDMRLGEPVRGAWTEIRPGVKGIYVGNLPF